MQVAKYHQSIDNGGLLFRHQSAKQFSLNWQGTVTVEGQTYPINGWTEADGNITLLVDPGTAPLSDS